MRKGIGGRRKNGDVWGNEREGGRRTWRGKGESDGEGEWVTEEGEGERRKRGRGEMGRK
jgi:hypothetical protein